MVKIAFLGSRPLGVAALRVLQAIPDVEIIGAVVKRPPQNAWWDEDPFFLPLPQIRHDDLADLPFDLGVSINYWKIIEPALIAQPALGFINLHHSYNLSLRGRDMTTHAILNARDTGRWYHGTTLHYTDDGLDTGPIIASESCPITEQDTAWTLFQKTEAVGMTLLKTWLPRLLRGRPPVASPENDQPLNMRAKNEDIRFIPDVAANPLRAFDIVRAYDFNGHYPPATTMIDGQHMNLSISAGDSRTLLADLGEGRRIFAVPTS